MAENCHRPTSRNKENMFFEDYFFGRPMSDAFSTDFKLFHMWLQYKSEKVYELFGSELEKAGAHCVDAIRWTCFLAARLSLQQLLECFHFIQALESLSQF